MNKKMDDQGNTSMVRNCKFSYKCDKTWHALEETHDSTRRFCSSCQEHVTLVYLDKQLAKHIRQNDCVAVCDKAQFSALTGHTFSKVKPLKIGKKIEQEILQIFAAGEPFTVENYQQLEMRVKKIFALATARGYLMNYEILNLSNDGNRDNVVESITQLLKGTGIQVFEHQVSMGYPERLQI